MHPVFVLVFHAPACGPGRLAAALAAARLDLAGHHAWEFRAAGAADVRIIAEPDGRPFGARLRDAATLLPMGAGLVTLGSGAIPLATTRDRGAFVAAAGAAGVSVDSGAREATAPAGRGVRGATAPAGHPAAGPRREGPVALANNRFSGDVVAIPDARRVLAALPDLDGDNALPRWLAEHAGLAVVDLRGRRALQADLDGLADLELLARSPRCPAVLRAAAVSSAADLADLRERIAAVMSVAADSRAEIVVAGRVSSAGLVHLERATACRVRALVEERGLRASDPRAQGEAPTSAPTGPRARVSRPPVSILGMLLDRDGPDALGPTLARLGDAAIVDTRVLLAHRLGADERSWPSLEDRLASDLGRADLVADPWLRSLTASAESAPIPVLLGGHSLVGPGLDLLFPTRRPAGDAAAVRAGDDPGSGGRRP